MDAAIDRHVDDQALLAEARFAAAAIARAVDHIDDAAVDDRRLLLAAITYLAEAYAAEYGVEADAVAWALRDTPAALAAVRRLRASRTLERGP